MLGPSKKAAVSAAKGVDERERLAHIQTLWEQLARLRENSTEYEAMVRQIRKEADAFRKLVESRTTRDKEEE
jgi:predicted  nucleic acid-binding Zn-ribbon protein